MSSLPKNLFASVLAGLLVATVAHAQIKVGDRCPDLSAAGLEGTVPATAGQVVWVDFWASWCAPCKASFPVYAKINDELRPRGLSLIAVSVDEKAADYTAFLKREKPPFATVRDAGQKVVAAFRPPAMPTTYLIDRRGVVRFIHSGFHGADTEKELRAELTALLAEKP
ncbi:MAG: TlpA disulfide reductase family protein [Verrucomicrobiota bacterium]